LIAVAKILVDDTWATFSKETEGSSETSESI